MGCVKDELKIIDYINRVVHEYVEKTINNAKIEKEKTYEQCEN